MEIDLRSDDGTVSIPILGQPKAFAIIPWKSSELCNAVSRSMPRLRIEVFMRALSYYEVRSEAKYQSGPPAKMNATQLATAAHRRKS